VLYNTKRAQNKSAVLKGSAFLIFKLQFSIFNEFTMNQFLNYRSSKFKCQMSNQILMSCKRRSNLREVAKVRPSPILALRQFFANKKGFAYLSQNLRLNGKNRFIGKPRVIWNSWFFHKFPTINFRKKFCGGLIRLAAKN